MDLSKLQPGDELRVRRTEFPLDGVYLYLRRGKMLVERTVSTRMTDYSKLDVYALALDKMLAELDDAALAEVKRR